MKIPKHEHRRDFLYQGKYRCWCQFPYCTEISRLKKRGSDVALTAIYELIQREKKGAINSIPLDKFLKVR